MILADDLKIFKTISSDFDCLVLQQNLAVFDNWCYRNGLSLNHSKCKIISFYHTKKPIVHNYKLKDTDILRVDLIRDLGILFDSKLSFLPHLNSAISKARRLLGFTFRVTASFKDISTLKFLYVHIVRSQLEYLTVIWNPHYRVHIDALERVQHKFLRAINFKLGIASEDLNYNDLLTKLQLPTLESRRIFFDLSFLYKLFSNKIDCPEILSKINLRIPSHNSRSMNMFIVEFHRTGFSFHNATDRIQRTANIYAPFLDLANPSIPHLKRTVFSYN